MDNETTDPVAVLKRVMDDADLNQPALAAEIGSSIGTVNRWLNRRTTLTERKLRQVIQRLGMNPEEYGLRPVKSATWGTPPGAAPLLTEEGPAWLIDAVQRIEDKLDKILRNQARERT